MALIVSTDDDGEAHTRIDGSHAVHVDEKGHSEMCLTMEKGAMMNVSKKLGLVTMILKILGLFLMENGFPSVVGSDSSVCYKEIKQRRMFWCKITRPMSSCIRIAHFRLEKVANMRMCDISLWLIR